MRFRNRQAPYLVVVSLARVRSSARLKIISSTILRAAPVVFGQKRQVATPLGL